MLYAIISDVHANASALRAVLADATERGVKAVVSLGDVVGYGPLPVEAIEILRRVAAVSLAGNHDDAVSGRMDASAFNGLAADAVARHRAVLSKNDLDWLASRPYRAEIEGGVLVHGDVTDPAKFYYVENEQDAEANFRATDAALIFVGHTHVPALFVTGESGRVYRTDPQDFSLEDGKRYIVNPGSVGYPREMNGTCLSSYVLYDSTARTVVYRFLPFSVASVMQRGPAPRRWRGRVLVASLALAAAAGAGIWMAGQGRQVPNGGVTVRTEDVAGRKTLALSPERCGVRLGLSLSKGSSPAEVKVVFSDAHKRTVGTAVRTVKSRSDAFVAAPKDAASAEVTVRASIAGARPSVASFEPQVVMRPERIR